MWFPCAVGALRKSTTKLCLNVFSHSSRTLWTLTYQPAVPPTRSSVDVCFVCFLRGVFLFSEVRDYDRNELVASDGQDLRKQLFDDAGEKQNKKGTRGAEDGYHRPCGAVKVLTIEISVVLCE